MPRANWLRLTIIFTVLCLGTGSLYFATYQYFSWKETRPIARVGDYVIKKQDVIYRNAVTKVYFPNEQRDLGLKLMTETLVLAQVLKELHHEITPDILIKESARIDKSTLRPEMLATIKNIFGDDEKSYQFVYIMNVYAERAIYEVFMGDESIHAPSKRPAEAFLQSALADPDQFKKTAEASGAKMASFSISLSRGLEWEKKDGLKRPEHKESVSTAGLPLELQKHLQTKERPDEISEEGRRWIQDVVGPMKPGQVFPKVVDRRDNWLVCRFLGPAKQERNTYSFSGVIFPKANFGEWLDLQKRKVSIHLENDI